MAKAKTKSRKLTTNQAVEQLLGRKAAKRLRQIAVQFTADKKKASKKK